ncbi:PAS domain S-box protein [Oscillatoria acuminata]|uniref:Circadian input-output histidine kinase CikA n=1 Tax=Oscillatoria acuminata PCC 6304 TaxID=56110 RepID=K9TM13_9CYAN|nr:PAS domain S-box protein [Oscillatoria acuminata]AFY83054.1 PAS domain S-box [Oscillatoria acuminata PCC 6304]
MKTEGGRSYRGEVLVVDDTVANLKLLVDLLSGHGYKVRAAPNGLLALQAVEVSIPDLILLDIMMPDLNGYDVCKHLKSHEETRPIPIIFISALYETFDKVRGFAVGGSDYITKPFQEAEVLARIEHQIKLQNLERELRERNVQLSWEIQGRNAAEQEKDKLIISLQKSQKSLATAQRVAGVGNWELNWLARHLELSDEMFRVLGMPPQLKPSYAEVLKMIHPQDRSRFSKIIKQAIVSGSSYQIEGRIQRPDGEIRYVEAKGEVILDLHRKPIQIFGTILDITTRKQVKIQLEKQLIRSELLRGITEKIRSELRLEKLLDTAASEIREALGVSGTEIYTYLESRIPSLQIEAFAVAEGYQRSQELELPLDENPYTPKFLEHDRCIPIPNIQTDPLFQPVLSRSPGFQVKSMLLVRTSYKGQPNGALVLHEYDRPREWNLGEIELIETIAAQVGIAIAQANLLKREKQARAKLNQQNQQLQQQINARILTETALKTSESKYRNLVETSQDLIWTIDTKGRITFVNAAVRDIYGYSPSEAMGRAFTELIHPSRWSQDQEFFRKILLEKQEISQYETTHITQAGTPIYMMLNAIPLRDEAGFVIGITGTASNITQLKQTQAKLIETNRLQKAILNSAEHTIIATDPQGTILTFNAAAERLLGYKAHEVTTQANVVIIHTREELQERADTLTAELGYAVAPGFDAIVAKARLGVPDIREWTYLRKDGSRFPVWLSITALQDAIGQITGFLGIGSDITDRKQAEEALKQAAIAAQMANHAKSEFLANMSHELRTPLNAILGFAQVMAGDPSLHPEHQQQIEIINRAGSHLLELINDILEMSKIEAGRTTLKIEPFDLGQMLRDLEDMLQFKAHEKNLLLSTEVTPNVPLYIRADQAKLRQVLINILGNAIKFTQRGAITLRVHRGSGEFEWGNHRDYSTEFLQFEVEDTGPGIAPEEMNLIFESFGQTETGRKSGQGTGLGLPISRQFVRMMGGEIQVNSVVGVGSTFIFVIQVEEVDPSEVPQTQSKGMVIGLAPDQPTKRILVVDDMLESRLLLVKLLGSIGFEVREAENGQEAIATSLQWQPDLILMDIRMPIMDGYEATKQIKAIVGSHKPAILALTASVFEEDRSAVFAAGCDDFLRKPLEKDELLEKIGHHLNTGYIYAPNSSPYQRFKPEAETGEISLEQLQSYLGKMPPQWIAKIYDAAAQCSDDMILELIEEMPPDFEPAGRALTQLAENFQFHQIMHLTYSEDL